MSDDLVALGKQNGAVIADYVVSRMQAGNMSPAQAVEALAAYLASHIDELKANGVPEERLMPWVGAVQKAFDKRLERWRARSQPGSRHWMSRREEEVEAVGRRLVQIVSQARPSGRLRGFCVGTGCSRSELRQVR